MSRSVPEWIGKSDDSVAPKSVRARVFITHGGICHISKRVIRGGEAWELEHVKPLWAGGQNRESNLAPALVEHHRVKTSQEATDRAKADRTHAKHFGYHPKPVRKLQGPGFDKRRSPA